MPGRSFVRLLVLPGLLLAAVGCGAPATPAAKPSIRIVSPATGSNFVTSGPTEAVTVRWAVSHFTAGGSNQIRLDENGKLWGMVTSNSIGLILAAGSYRFTAELVTNGKVMAASAPVVVTVSAAHVSATLSSLCNTRISLTSNGQPARTVSLRLTCLPAGEQIFHETSPGNFFYAPDSSGNLWFVVGRPFSLTGSNAPLGIGRITPTGTFSLFATPGNSLLSPGPAEICLYPLTLGPGGMWFGCPGSIGRISPSGTVSLFTKGLPGSTSSIGNFVPGLGGDLWFDGTGSSHTNFIGKITPSGTITVLAKALHPLFTCSTGSACYGNDLTLGPGGDIWFTGRGLIGKITPSGAVTLFTQGLQQMCTDWAQSCLHPGPGSDMLFYIGSSVEPGSTGFGLITPSGSVTRFTNDLYPSAPCSPQTAGCGVGSLTIGPSGDIWLAGSGPNHVSFVDRISPSGTITHFTKGLPASTSFSGNLVVGPSGNMWFVGSGSNNADFIGKISPSGVISVFSKGLYPSASCSTPMSCSVGNLTLGPGGEIWFLGNASANSGPPFIGEISSSGTVTLFTKGLPVSTSSVSDLVQGPTGDLSFFGSVDSGPNPPTFFGQISPSGTTANLP